jgi:4-cresol dehydrogenase (hydroxylating)
MMMKMLPDGVTRPDFDSAVVELREAVGREWVFTEKEQGLRAYNDHFSPVEPILHAPSAAVAPKTIDQIQQVLTVARKYRIPLWPISTGRNLAYGGSAPRQPGCIVLDLKRMNRILEVNEKHAYAVVEPGVSYFDLYNYIQSKGLKLWIDPAAPGWGSVVGNCLDRGGGYTPYGEHFHAQCGMQVVLADGTVVDTGLGSVAESTAANTYKYGSGPWVDGIFTQSNFGVVTKLGMWLMPEPPGYRPYMVTFQKEEDVEPVTDIVRELIVSNLLPNSSVTVGLLLEAAVSVTKEQYYSGKGPVPESVRRKIMRDLDVGYWNFYGALYGSEAYMDISWDIIADAFNQIPGARFFFEKDRPKDIAFGYRAKLQKGVPNMTEFNMLNWIPGGAHLTFSPLTPVSGKDALKQYRLVSERVHEYGFDYTGEFIVRLRNMHHGSALIFNRTDEDSMRRVHALYTRLVEEYAAEGYGMYRTHLEFMDQIAAIYNWNNRAMWRTHELIKDSLDPLGILAPGKMGIWPERMRGSTI